MMKKLYRRQYCLYLWKTDMNHCGKLKSSEKQLNYMRMKKYYMGDDRLLPRYNIQLEVCDEYISVYDIKQYASDMGCFVLSIEKFKSNIKNIPNILLPMRDSSFNNYLYCEEHEMKKYIKFTMYKKASKDKCKGNIIIRLNEELTAFHREVLSTLNCIHGVLLRMNRSIQSEGTNGIIKWNRLYTRVRRRGLKALNLEICLIYCSFNLHKFHLKKALAKSDA